MRTGWAIEQQTCTAPEIILSAATAVSEATDKTLREVECSCWCKEHAEKIECGEDSKKHEAPRWEAWRAIVLSSGLQMGVNTSRGHCLPGAETSWLLGDGAGEPLGGGSASPGAAETARFLGPASELQNLSKWGGDQQSVATDPVTLMHAERDA